MKHFSVAISTDLYEITDLYRAERSKPWVVVEILVRPPPLRPVSDEQFFYSATKIRINKPN